MSSDETSEESVQSTLHQATSANRDSEEWSSSEWDRLKNRRLELDDHSCCNCGRSDRQLHVHHIVPDTNGGTTTIGNLRTLCYECHAKVHINDDIPTIGARRAVEASYLPMVHTLREFFSSITHPHHQAVLLLLAKTGIRVDEAASLELDQLHLSNSPIGYDGIGPRQPRRHNHVVVYEKNRTGSPGSRGTRLSDVMIPLDREMSTALRRCLAIRPDPASDVEEDLVFLNASDRWGHPITPSAIRSIMKKYAAKSGLHQDKGSNSENVTPITLGKFFDERFEGQPATRDYILGRCETLPYPFPQLVTDYREGMPTLIE